jgi:hypothetical protein
VAVERVIRIEALVICLCHGSEDVSLGLISDGDHGRLGGALHGHGAAKSGSSSGRRSRLRDVDYYRTITVASVDVDDRTRLRLVSANTLHLRDLRWKGRSVVRWWRCKQGFSPEIGE